MKGKYIWNNLERYGMMFFFIVFFLNVFIQIVSRVIFKAPFRFTEELSRYCFVWMVFLGMAFATKYDKHVRVDVFVNLLPRTLQYMIGMVIDVITLVVFVWVVYYGMLYIGYSSITRVYTMPLNKGVVVAIIPLTGILVIIRCIEKIGRDLQRMRGKIDG